MALELPRSSEKGNYSNDQTLLENDTKTKIPIQSMGINGNTENQNTQEQHAEDNEVLFIIDIRFCNETRFLSARVQDQIAIFYCPSMYHSREIPACIRRQINA